MPSPVDLVKQFLLSSRGREKPADTFPHEALKHLTSLYNFALRLARNADDAADLVQETYLRALRFQNRFQPGTNLRAWMFKILRNAFIDSYWRQSWERAVEDPDPQGASATLAAVEGVLGEYAEAMSRAVRVDLTGALEDLPEQFRTAVVLSDVEGFTVEQIADIMDCPTNTVKTRLFRGRRLLRERLKAYGD